MALGILKDADIMGPAKDNWPKTGFGDGFPGSDSDLIRDQLKYPRDRVPLDIAALGVVEAAMLIEQRHAEASYMGKIAIASEAA